MSGAPVPAESTLRISMLVTVMEHATRCSDDELRVVLAGLRVLEKSRNECGPIDLDANDWSAELADDLITAVLYRLAVHLAGNHATTPPENS